MNDDARMMSGSEVGGYTLVRRLGSGGSGVVWEVEDAGGEHFALKLLHPVVAEDPTARTRLAREAMMINRIHTPGVARVVDVETEAVMPFVVTELVEGITLDNYLRSHGPMPLDEVYSYGLMLRETLVAVHAARVIHRDLKPSNVMVTERGPVLIDFGIAKAGEDERLTRTGLVSGTPGWVAPEVIAGEVPSEASDWWSWAALIVMMVTGRPPFGAGGWEAVLSRVHLGHADLDGIPQPLATTLRAALAPIPRTGDAVSFSRPDPEEILAAIDRAIDGVSGAEASVTTVFDSDVTRVVEESGAPGGTTVLARHWMPVSASMPTAWDVQQQWDPPGQREAMEEPWEPPRPQRSYVLAVASAFLLAALPVAFGALGGVVALVVLVLTATIGRAASWRTQRQRLAGGSRRFDTWQATLRCLWTWPADAAGIALSTVVAGTLVVVAWLLTAVTLGLDARDNPLISVMSDVPAMASPTWQAVVPDVVTRVGLWASGLFVITVVRLGMSGRHLGRGVHAVATTLIPSPVMRLVIALAFVGVAVAAVVLL